VKVKRGLFSYPGEEHLPSQNMCPAATIAYSAQIHANRQLVEILDLMLPADAPLALKLKNAHSCTFTAGQGLQGKNKIEIRLGFASKSYLRLFATFLARSDTAARARL
jgi:hypothetical protein